MKSRGKLGFNKKCVYSILGVVNQSWPMYLSIAGRNSFTQKWENLYKTNEISIPNHIRSIQEIPEHQFYKIKIDGYCDFNVWSQFPLYLLPDAPFSFSMPQKCLDFKSRIFLSSDIHPETGSSSFSRPVKFGHQQRVTSSITERIISHKHNTCNKSRIWI
jgi:hypothetical protein